VPGLENYSKNALKVIGKAKAAAGDRVRIVKAREVYEGTLLPRAELGDRNSLVIKLDNGYNVGIGASGTKLQKLKGDMHTLEGEFGLQKWREQAKAKLKHDPDKPTIVILHTGGTVASRVDYRTGGVTSSFTPEDIIHMFPELTDIANIKSRLIRNMWSEDMRFGHYTLIAKEVAKEIAAGVDGIIITHGTDTLHYTSAALSFMLQELPIPVLLVGAQRSSDRPSSDAGMNLICATRFMANSDWSGVGVCMHEGSSDETSLILPGTKARKMHSSRRDAFRPINATAIARIKYPSGDIEMIADGYVKKDKGRKLKMKDRMEEKVALFKIHTNMFPEAFDLYRKAGYKGVVIEGTGLGHTPLHVPDQIARVHAKIRKAVSELAKKAVVVMTSQALYGRVNMNVYSKGRDLQALGVIPGEDMLPETAFIKLAWALGNFKRSEAASIMRKNIAGEISDVSEVDDFLI
jgi:glutamyl-tRNA(Gln) amidotransferase subunit D